jgi:hypothetical protein
VYLVNWGIEIFKKTRLLEETKNRPLGTSGSPDAAAISMAAEPSGSMAYCAVMASPNGSVARHEISSPHAASSAHHAFAAVGNGQ